MMMRSVGLMALPLIVGLMAGPLLAESGPSGPDILYFAEPFSGRAVEGYTINLPVSRDEKRRFQIPGDCASVESALREGAGAWGTRVERRLWPKVDADCHYAGLAAAGEQQVQEDHVSQFDFMNAPLSLLPIVGPCDEAPDSQCLLINPSFQFLDIRPGLTEGEECRIVDGVFRGVIGYHGGQMVCQADRDAPGFRVMSAFCADVNADQRRDALLRILPLGAGVASRPVVIPLSRSMADAPFKPASGLGLSRRHAPDHHGRDSP